MKKSIFYVALLLLSSTSAIAQFSIGARVAGNLANVNQSLDDEYEFNPKHKIGIAFGVIAEIGLSEMFAIQPEVLYSQHGWRLDENFLGYPIKVEVRNSYLQVPILAKLTLGSEAFGINVLGGPHIGFGIGDLTSESDGESEATSWKDAGLKTFDYGLTGGIGVAFKAGPGKLGVDARYQFGLANMLDDPEGDDKVSNRNLQIGLSYLLPIGN